MMRLNANRLSALMEVKGWSEVDLSRQLDLDYSYVYRVFRKERNIGKKFVAGLIKLSEREGLDFKDFILFD